MKFRAKDLKRLGLPVAVCLALALVGVACYFIADDYLQDTRKQRAAVAAQRAEVQGRLDRANEEEREIKANLQQYRALEARGITGEEKRLDWIDALTAIKSERRLFNITYSIEPQKPLDYPGFGSSNGAYFMTSRAKVNLQLLHEEDLLNFVDDLARRSKLHLSARSCNIQRLDRGVGGGGAVLVPRLQAECTFDLITIRHTKPA
jgi:hypothetical protein